MPLTQVIKQFGSIIVASHTITIRFTAQTKQIFKNCRSACVIMMMKDSGDLKYLKFWPVVFIILHDSVQ